MNVSLFASAKTWEFLKIQFDKCTGSIISIKLVYNGTYQKCYKIKSR